jgi:hypothetical protein
MVLATFLAICSVAVVFLLRFLIALGAEGRSARNRATARGDLVSDQRIQTGTMRDPLLLTRSHYTTPPQGYRSPVSREAFVPRERKSQLKRA